MLEKFKTSKKWTYGVYLIIFGFMLIMNVLTHMTADDFSYSINMGTANDRVSSLSEIFKSLELHKEYVNGRLIPHFFVYLFVMLPSFVFDLVNSAVFTLMIFLMSVIGNPSGKRNNLIPALMFAFTALCQPSFGQQFLWIAGACNYLWCMPFALAFLLPYYNYLVHGKTLHPALWAPFFLTALCACAYSENMSAGIMFTAGCFILATKLIFKKKLRAEHFIALGIGFVGYCFMVFQQGTKDQKLSNFQFGTVMWVLFVGLAIIATLVLPIFLYVLFLRRSKREGVKRERLFATYIFIAGGLCSNFIMLVADVYPHRCATYMVVTLLLALSILYSSLENVSFGKHTKKICASFLVFTTLFIGFGVFDVCRMHVNRMEMEAVIEEAKASGGSTDVYVPMEKAISKFSAQRGHVYFSSVEADGRRVWPNREAAIYYEVDSILGKWEK